MATAEVTMAMIAHRHGHVVCELCCAIWKGQYHDDLCRVASSSNHWNATIEVRWSTYMLKLNLIFYYCSCCTLTIHYYVLACVIRIYTRIFGYAGYSQMHKRCQFCGVRLLSHCACERVCARDAVSIGDTCRFMMGVRFALDHFPMKSTHIFSHFFFLHSSSALENQKRTAISTLSLSLSLLLQCVLPQFISVRFCINVIYQEFDIVVKSKSKWTIVEIDMQFGDPEYASMNACVRASWKQFFSPLLRCVEYKVVDWSVAVGFPLSTFWRMRTPFIRMKVIKIANSYYYPIISRWNVHVPTYKSTPHPHCALFFIMFDK